MAPLVFDCDKTLQHFSRDIAAFLAHEPPLGRSFPQADGQLISPTPRPHR